MRYVFDRPVPEDSGEAWYWRDDAAAWEYSTDRATVVSYLGQLFESAAALLRPYSDGQIAQGLGYLIDNSLSNYLFPLMDPDVPWNERQHAIRAMYVVFERIVDPKCSPHLSHARTEPDPSINPLNGVCYMWWDVCPLQGHAGPTAEEDVILATEELVDPGPRVDPHAADLEGTPRCERWTSRRAHGQWPPSSTLEVSRCSWLGSSGPRLSTPPACWTRCVACGSA